MDVIFSRVISQVSCCAFPLPLPFPRVSHINHHELPPTPDPPTCLHLTKPYRFQLSQNHQPTFIQNEHCTPTSTFTNKHTSSIKHRHVFQLFPLDVPLPQPSPAGSAGERANESNPPRRWHQQGFSRASCSSGDASIDPSVSPSPPLSSTTHTTRTWCFPTHTASPEAHQSCLKRPCPEHLVGC